jgi:hypothetical protein
MQNGAATCMHGEQHYDAVASSAYHRIKRNLCASSCSLALEAISLPWTERYSDAPIAHSLTACRAIEPVWCLAAGHRCDQLPVPMHWLFKGPMPLAATTAIEHAGCAPAPRAHAHAPVCLRLRTAVVVLIAMMLSRKSQQRTDDSTILACP